MHKLRASPENTSPATSRADMLEGSFLGSSDSNVRLTGVSKRSANGQLGPGTSTCFVTPKRNRYYSSSTVEASEVTDVRCFFCGKINKVSNSIHHSQFPRIFLFGIKAMRSCCTSPCVEAICRQPSTRPGHLLDPPQATVHGPIRQPTKRSALLRNVIIHASAGSTDREPNFDSVSFRQDAGSTASTSSVIDVTDQAQREGRMEEVQQFLKEELDRIFSDGVSCACILQYGLF